MLCLNKLAQQVRTTYAHIFVNIVGRLRARVRVYYDDAVRLINDLCMAQR